VTITSRAASSDAPFRRHRITSSTPLVFDEECGSADVADDTADNVGTLRLVAWVLEGQGRSSEGHFLSMSNYLHPHISISSQRDADQRDRQPALRP